MAKHVDYYLSLNSPWSYMGGARLAAAVRDTGATVAVRPIKLPVILDKTGGLPLPKRSPERQAYRLVELERWRAYLNVPINLKPAHFPSDETLAAKAVIVADRDGRDALALAIRLGKALWEEEKSLADENTIRQAAKDCGLDDDALLEAATDGPVDSLWTANTTAAIDAGVFGVPSYVVDGDVFWGQDRLDFVARALKGA